MNVLCIAITLNVATASIKTHAVEYHYWEDVRPQWIHDYMQMELELADQIKMIVVVTNDERFPSVVHSWVAERDFTTAPTRR